MDYPHISAPRCQTGWHTRPFNSISIVAARLALNSEHAHDLSAAAAATASATKPCAKCGNLFAETWNSGGAWQCFDCKEPVADGTRAATEFAAMQSVIRLDAARAPTG